MKTYSSGEFSKLIGISRQTLQKWDRTGKFKAFRRPSGHRYYTEEQLNEYFGIESKTKRENVAYCRVSSRKQKEGIENQESYIMAFANALGIVIDHTYSDIASGLNYERKEWNTLLKRVEKKEIETIYITYKDRFVRFGFEWFEKFCNEHGTEIVTLNQKNTSLEEELADDLMSIVHVFSCKSYGMRNYKTI